MLAGISTVHPSSSLLAVDEARARIIWDLPVTASERVPLEEALGRIAAQCRGALAQSPPFAVSAMDGYAVRAADVPRGDTILRLAGEVRAGMTMPGALEEGACLRIFTGAAVPGGADSIIIQENADQEGALVHFRTAAIPGEHIRRAGGNLKVSQLCVAAGRRAAGGRRRIGSGSPLRCAGRVLIWLCCVSRNAGRRSRAHVAFTDQAVLR
ncbi:hypothetical protein [Terrihabitans sp. B22-R8]|uniref:hypothetical protein n=1 Tax=Terrihabitans sp. B22-R8 TaxID=3425128 RepID=UPI00403C40CE